MLRTIPPESFGAAGSRVLLLREGSCITPVPGPTDGHFQQAVRCFAELGNPSICRLRVGSLQILRLPNPETRTSHAGAEGVREHFSTDGSFFLTSGRCRLRTRLSNFKKCTAHHFLFCWPFSNVTDMLMINSRGNCHSLGGSSWSRRMNQLELEERRQQAAGKSGNDRISKLQRIVGELAAHLSQSENGGGLA